MTSMPNSVPIVTIFGGSGFIGRYVTQRMARAGWRVRVAVRRPERGAASCGPTASSARSSRSRPTSATRPRPAARSRGADAVVNCVGILVESGKQQLRGGGRRGRRPRRPASPPRQGAAGWCTSRRSAPTRRATARYARAKAQGEAAVREAFPAAVILRPSIVFGAEDGFFNRFAAMARLIAGAAAGRAGHPLPAGLCRRRRRRRGRRRRPAASRPGVYELGGPEVATFRELMQRMLAVIRRRRLIVDAARRGSRGCRPASSTSLQRASFGLFTNTLLTRDQVRAARAATTSSRRAPRGFAELGIVADRRWRRCSRATSTPTGRSGQYAAIQESAVRLRT